MLGFLPSPLYLWIPLVSAGFEKAQQWQQQLERKGPQPPSRKQWPPGRQLLLADLKRHPVALLHAAEPHPAFYIEKLPPSYASLLRRRLTHPSLLCLHPSLAAKREGGTIPIRSHDVIDKIHRWQN